MNRDKVQSNEGDVKHRRRYESPKRQEQARETRALMLDAARDLFVAQGYGATTIAEIATAAGVSVQLVYAVFGSKREVLFTLLGREIGGDDQLVDVLEREGPQRMRMEVNQHTQLRMMAHGIAEIMERSGPIFAVVRNAAASDSAIAEVYAGLLEERRRNFGTVIGWVVARGPLKAGLDEEIAADLLWTLTSPDVWHLLRVDRCWLIERYEVWLGEMLIAALLP